MKKYLMSIVGLVSLVALLRAPLTGFAQTPATPPANAPKPAAPTTGAATVPSSPEPPNAPQPTRIQIKGRNGNGDINIEVSEAQAEKFREMMKDPDVQKSIERGLGRLADKSTEWRGVAALAMLVPFGAFALAGFVIWWAFRRSRERMQARMDMHNVLLAKFSTGAEFTEFISSRGGREYMEQITTPSHNQSGGFWRTAWVGYVCTAMGAGMILVRLIEGGRSIMGGVVLLAIGIGHLLSMRSAKQAAEKLGPPAGLNGGTAMQPPSLGTRSE